MVLSVSVIYGLCWMPNQFIYVFNYFIPSQTYGNVIYIVSIVLVSCNSTVIPLSTFSWTRSFDVRLRVWYAVVTLQQQGWRLHGDWSHQHHYPAHPGRGKLQCSNQAGSKPIEPGFSVTCWEKKSVFSGQSLHYLPSPPSVVCYIDSHNEKPEYYTKLCT